MKQITITGTAGTVKLLKDIEFTITPQMVESSTVMASGKIVLDSRGVRDVLTIPTGWLNKANLDLLTSMIASERFLTVAYPDISGDKVKRMLFDPPSLRSFKYDSNGVDIWYGVTLTARSQNISTYEGGEDIPADYMELACATLNERKWGTV